MKKICTLTGRGYDEPEFVAELYDSLGLPTPTTHPQFRHLERAAHVNTWALYHAKDARTGKTILSIYDPQEHPIIYDHAYWSSPDFDAREYGRALDFTRPFFDQFAELVAATPKQNIISINSEECNFSNAVYNSKRCYLAFAIIDCENLMYTSRAYSSKDSIGLHITSKCELCYECVQCVECYNVAWASFSKQCSDSRFLYNCTDVTNSYQCANLKHKQYCIQNKQHTKEEYERIMATIDLASWTTFQAEKKRWKDFLATQPMQAEMLVGCENSDGTMLSSCSDAKRCFSLTKGEHCSNCYGTGGRDAADSAIYSGSERIVFANTINCQSAAFSHLPVNSSNIYYCQLVSGVTDCFGCYGIKNVRSCILNKQYSDEEYVVLKNRLIEHMKSTGEWGKFFPAKDSPFLFADSYAARIFSKAEVDEARGLGLRMDQPKVAPESMPSNVSDTSTLPDMPDGFTDFPRAYRCTVSGKAYKILPQEVDFYKKMRIPLPRTAWSVRLDAGVRNSFRLPQEAQCSVCTKEIFSAFRPEEIGSRPLLCDVCWNERFN